MQQKWQKNISKVLLLCFIFQQNGLAQIPNTKSLSISEISFQNLETSSLLSEIKIPSEWGKIENIHSGSGPILFHVQTAHGLYDAQKNIHALLNYLNKTYGTTTLLLEGSAEKLQPEILRLFPTHMDETMKVNDVLTRHALVKGPELFLIENPEGKGYGIENHEAYLQNLSIFKEVLVEKEKTKSFLDSMNEQIDRLSSAHLSKELKTFLSLEDLYQTKRRGMENWLKDLDRYAFQTLGIHLNHPVQQLNWPMLYRYFTLEQLQTKIDLKEFHHQKQSFLKEIKSFLNESHYTSIEGLLKNQASHDLFSIHHNAAVLYDQMAEKLPKSFPYQRFEHVNRVIAVQILQSEIQPFKLGEEVSHLAHQIALKLAATPEQESILEFLNQYRLLKKLFALELTPSDYETVLNLRTMLEPSVIAERFMKLHQGDLRIKEVKFTHLNELDYLYTLSLNFYEKVKERDGFMLKNIQSHLESTQEKSLVVVTGGFHAHPFEDYFSSKNQNYVLIAPKIISSEKEMESGRTAYLRTIVQDGNLQESTVESKSLLAPSDYNSFLANQAAQLAADSTSMTPELFAELGIPQSSSRSALQETISNRLKGAHQKRSELRWGAPASIMRKAARPAANNPAARVALIRRAQPIIDYLSASDLGEADIPDVFIIHGQSDPKTFEEFAKAYAKYKKSIPIIVVDPNPQTLSLLQGSWKSSIKPSQVTIIQTTSQDTVPFTRTADSIRNSIEALAQIVGSKNNPLIVTASRPDRSLRFKQTVLGVFHRNDRTKNWLVKSLRNHEINLDSLETTLLINLLGESLGYPTAWVDQHPNLNALSELEGLKVQWNPLVRPLRIPDAIVDDHTNALSLFESFLRTTNVVYDSKTNHLVPSQRSEVRSKEILIQAAQPYIDYLSDADDFSTQVPDVFLVLGQPDLRTYLEFIKAWKKYSSEGKNIPIVIAGGRGRGTVPLIQSIISHYGSSRDAESWIDWLQTALADESIYEAEIIERLLNREGISSQHIKLETQASKTTAENFLNSRSPIETIISPKTKPVIAVVTRPNLLRRAKRTALGIWNQKGGKDWDVKSLRVYQPDLASLSYEELIQLLGYSVGYPASYISQYKSLNPNPEIRGLDPKHNPHILPEAIPETAASAYAKTVDAFKVFLDSLELRYNATINHLVPVRSEVRINEIAKLSRSEFESHMEQVNAAFGFGKKGDLVSEANAYYVAGMTEQHLGWIPTLQIKMRKTGITEGREAINDSENGTHILGALLSDDQLSNWQHQFDFERDVMGNAEQAAEFARISRETVSITQSPLHGGIGESVQRLKLLEIQLLEASLHAIIKTGESGTLESKYAKAYRTYKTNLKLGRTGNIIKALRQLETLAEHPNKVTVKQGAKGTDLGIIRQKNGEKIFISSAEGHFLQLIYAAEHKEFAKIRFRALVNFQSQQSFLDLLKKPYFLDVWNEAASPRTYGDVLKEKGIEFLDVYDQKDVPKIEILETEFLKDRKNAKGLPTSDFSSPNAKKKRQPGGHGQIGVYFVLLFSQPSKTAIDGLKRIELFGNGDNPNMRSNPHLAGFVIKKHLPIMGLNTPATLIDKKGGKWGVIPYDVEGTVVYVPVMVEEVDAKNSGQAQMFYEAGQPGGIGRAGKQPFNTNLFYFERDLLQEILQEMKAAVGNDQEFFARVSPILFNKYEKAQNIDGKWYVSIDGAIAHVIQNLNMFYMLDPRFKELRSKIQAKYGIDRLLYFMNMPRWSFAPEKAASDWWLRNATDFYRQNEKTFIFEETIPNVPPPGLNFTDPKKKFNKVKKTWEKGDSNHWLETRHFYDFNAKSRVTAAIDIKVQGRVILPDVPVIWSGTPEIINLWGSDKKKSEQANTVNFRLPRFRKELEKLGLLKDGVVLHLENIRLTIQPDGKIIKEAISRSEVRATGIETLVKRHVLAGLHDQEGLPLATRVEMAKAVADQDLIPEFIGIETLEAFSAAYSDQPFAFAIPKKADDTIIDRAINANTKIYILSENTSTEAIAKIKANQSGVVIIGEASSYEQAVAVIQKGANSVKLKPFAKTPEQLRQNAELIARLKAEFPHILFGGAGGVKSANLKEVFTTSQADFLGSGIDGQDVDSVISEATQLYQSRSELRKNKILIPGETEAQRFKIIQALQPDQLQQTMALFPNPKDRLNFLLSIPEIHRDKILLQAFGPIKLSPQQTLPGIFSERAVQALSQVLSRAQTDGSEPNLIHLGSFIKNEPRVFKAAVTDNGDQITIITTLNAFGYRLPIPIISVKPGSSINATIWSSTGRLTFRPATSLKNTPLHERSEVRISSIPSIAEIRSSSAPLPKFVQHPEFMRHERALAVPSALIQNSREKVVAAGLLDLLGPEAYDQGRGTSTRQASLLSQVVSGKGSPIISQEFIGDLARAIQSTSSFSKNGPGNVLVSFEFLTKLGKENPRLLTQLFQAFKSLQIELDASTPLLTVVLPHGVQNPWKNASIQTISAHADQTIAQAENDFIMNQKFGVARIGLETLSGLLAPAQLNLGNKLNGEDWAAAVFVTLKSSLLASLLRNEQSSRFDAISGSFVTKFLPGFKPAGNRTFVLESLQELMLRSEVRRAIDRAA